MAKRNKTCGAKHPMHPQVRCGSEKGHVEAEHFDSFFMRSWDDDDWCERCGSSGNVHDPAKHGLVVSNAR